ncbi:hypothetical protein BDW02DRAFT_180187 [Decorospora gaudefroyi]|uniref:Yeast cell wall synthesis Kre9/Knh1-like N-terminal domain-containing protein n=1 Tax=Decorospora gaudefroyi TaxID=184978 RepID=A0A6A5KMW8_9PLEO|nr:hypothetical protein BDW02DRAFT_180187 [Decorospora gaudefroyi]
MYTKASFITFFAGLAAAQIHVPVGEPKGNPISRPLNEVVPTCESFTITWEPTTPNTVSILLLKGPSTNVVKFGPSLAEGIANSGSLTWTPAADLEATNGSPTGYGIQIIDDVTGQYQYSTQFGIEAGDCEDVPSSSSMIPASSSADSGYGYSTATPSPSSTPVHSSKGYSTMPPYPTSSLITKTSDMVYSTGAPQNSSSIVQPTRSLTIPDTLLPTPTGNATTSRLPEVTGAASAVQAGLGFAGALAAFALVL